MTTKGDWDRTRDRVEYGKGHDMINWKSKKERKHEQINEKGNNGEEVPKKAPKEGDA